MKIISRKTNIRGKLRELLREHSSHKLISFEFNNNNVKWGGKNLFQYFPKKEREKEARTYIFRQSCSTIKSNNFFLFLQVRIPFFKRKLKKKEEWKKNLTYQLLTAVERVKGMEERENTWRIGERPFGMRNFFTEPIIITLREQGRAQFKD